MHLRVARDFEIISRRMQDAEPFDHLVIVLLANLRSGGEFDLFEVPAEGALHLLVADVKFEIGSAAIAGEDAAPACVRRLSGDITAPEDFDGFDRLDGGLGLGHRREDSGGAVAAVHDW